MYFASSWSRVDSVAAIHHWNCASHCRCRSPRHSESLQIRTVRLLDLWHHYCLTKRIHTMMFSEMKCIYLFVLTFYFFTQGRIVHPGRRVGMGPSSCESIFGLWHIIENIFFFFFLYFQIHSKVNYTCADWKDCGRRTCCSTDLLPIQTNLSSSYNFSSPVPLLPFALLSIL